MESSQINLTVGVGYFCLKCDKYFSQTDFEESNYCRDCGGYLLKKYDCNNQKSTFTSNNSGRNPDLSTVAYNLRCRSENDKEYAIVAASAGPHTSQGIGSDGWIFGCELDDALRLKADLALKFEGKSLEEAIPGEILSNEHGECYCVKKNCKIPFKRASAKESRQRILSDLKLLPGIGQMREHLLNQQGYRTIEDLKSNLKWRKPADEFLRLVESKDVVALQKRLRRVLPKSHMLAHYLAGFCHNKDLVIIDIETLGLFGRPIILVGLAEVRKNGVCTRQFLARDVSEESAAIWELSQNLRLRSAFVSFNGRCFDLPFIRERMAYYGLSSEEAFENPHFDMLHFARRALKGKLRNYSLDSVEKYLGITRSINVPSALVPEFYDSYQRTGNVGPLVAIVEHNRQDLVTLLQLFCSLYREWGQ